MHPGNSTRSAEVIGELTIREYFSAVDPVSTVSIFKNPNYLSICLFKHITHISHPLGILGVKHILNHESNTLRVFFKPGTKLGGIISA